MHQGNASNKLTVHSYKTIYNYSADNFLVYILFGALLKISFVLLFNVGYYFKDIYDEFQRPGSW